MNNKQLYYIQQLGLTAWIQRESRIKTWKACLLTSTDDWGTSGQLGNSIISVLQQLLPSLDSIQVVSNAEDMIVDSDSAYLCFDFSSGFAQSLQQKLKLSKTVYKIIEQHSFTELASSAQLKKSLWHCLIEQSSAIHHA